MSSGNVSQENIEVLRQAMAAHNEGDIEGMVQRVHPEAEISIIGGFAGVMGEGNFSGHDGVRRFFKDWFATFQTVSVNHERFIEVGEQPVTLSRLKATVEGSPIPVELLTGQVWAFRDGKISRWDAYYTPEEAFEAVGLSGQDVAPPPSR